MNREIWGAALAAAIMLGETPSAIADVKAGVDAWTQGDYARAVAQWRPLAQAGDADAQFNMGQAYKLGRGVPVDFEAALDNYRKAAAQGHTRAEDNYGLLLFQQNRRVEAVPFIERSAERGEPRAQYLYGIALFNGDLVAKDWVRAYAMMTRASAADLPQATASLAQMNQYIPADQRTEGLVLATRLEQQQGAKLATTGITAPAPVRRSPGKLESVELPPSGPYGAGQKAAGVASSPQASPVPKADDRPPAPQRNPAGLAPSASDGWRVQLGAFSEKSRADTLWKSVTAKVKALADYQHFLVPGGNMTRLQAGPLTSRDEADRLCGEIKAAGSPCIVKAM